VLFDDLEPKDTIASVLVPVAVPVAYTYKVPAGSIVVPGSIVRVPLGTREVIGAVWDGEPDAAINPNKLKVDFPRLRHHAAARQRSPPVCGLGGRLDARRTGHGRAHGATV
jgi:hypothetical protein